MRSALQESDQAYWIRISVFICTITKVKLPDVHSPTEKKMLSRRKQKIDSLSIMRTEVNLKQGCTDPG
jgi:hypothetical protein